MSTKDGGKQSPATVPITRGTTVRIHKPRAMYDGWEGVVVHGWDERVIVHLTDATQAGNAMQPVLKVQEVEVVGAGGQRPNDTDPPKPEQGKVVRGRIVRQTGRKMKGKVS